MRHVASAGRNYDKKSDFQNPDNRGSTRTASHRYVAEARATSIATIKRRERAEESFSAVDFKARWWPASDAWQ